ncbi:MAG TPA: glycosyltransferase family 4 protein [Dehalococcoidia bacterium]|nr:glycosyltransferase family 4 protein [Dehalococcoidia bacterium]
MKIALVYDAIYPYMYGGAERRYYELGRRLAREHEVHLIGWQFWSGPARTVQAGMQLIGVGKPVAFYDRHGRRTLGEALKFALAALPACAAKGYDVLDCSSVPYLPVLSARLARLRSSIAVTWHEYMGERWVSYLGKRSTAAALIEKLCARVGRLRIAVSEFTARRLPGETPPTVVVPNGVDLETIEAAEAAPDGPDVLFVGRLLPHKQVGLALEALRRLDSRATFGIVGSGPEATRLRETAQRLGLSDRVRFYGPLTDSRAVYAVMKSARLLVQPSEQEGESIVVKEAMACGLPCVVVDAEFSAAKDLITEGENGFAVPGRADALAQALGALLEDESRRRQFAANALAAAQGFGWEHSARRIEAVYAGLAPRPAAARAL